MERSLPNKALVLREENQRKTDAMLLDPAIRVTHVGLLLRALHDAGLIGDKKFKSLMRSSVNENAMRGFIARQLVETNNGERPQSLLSAKYPDAKILPVKANMSHNLREAARVCEMP